MEGHQGGDQLPKTRRPDKHRAVQWMKTCSAHRTVRTRYRAATPPPPNNPPPRQRNADSAVPQQRPRRAHAPTAEVARPAVPRPHAVPAAPAPHPQRPAWSLAETPQRLHSASAPRACTQRVPIIRRLPAASLQLPLLPSARRSRPRRSLRFALRPPPTAERFPTETATDLRCENFLYCYQERCESFTPLIDKPPCPCGSRLAKPAVNLVQ